MQQPDMTRDWATAYGIEQLNTLTKYPSILTLHQLGEYGRLTNELTTPAVLAEPLYGTEKIHGTNCRILVFQDGSFLIGRRDVFLHHGGDLVYDASDNIVGGLRQHWLPLSINEEGHEVALPLRATYPGYDVSAPHVVAPLTVIYGEIYGGRINDHKNYGTDQFGFRIFDVLRFTMSELDELMKLSLVDLSRWRERETPEGLVYGQPFLSREELESYATERGLALAPNIVATSPALFSELSHADVLAFLKVSIPTSKVTLHEDAKGRPEGLVLASADRRVRVKVRYEDYERSLRPLSSKELERQKALAAASTDV